MSATFNKFNPFVQNLANGGLNMGSDQLAVALTDTLPTASESVISSITQISYTNFTGSPSYLALSLISSTQSGGTYNLKITSPTYSATGTIPQFRYVVIYDYTNNYLIGWFDYGAEVNLTNGDSFTVTFDGTNGLLSIT